MTLFAEDSDILAGFCECGNEPSVLHKMRGVSLLAENLLASHEELCCPELNGVMWVILLCILLKYFCRAI